MNNFIKNTVIGGIFFLIPVVIATAILGKAFKIMRSITVPLSEAFGADSARDVLLINSFTIFCIVFVCFLAGLFAKSIWGKKLFKSLDAVLLQFIPGYTILKNKTSEFDLNQAQSSLKPILIHLDDQSQIAFEVERTENNQVVVFLPGSPDTSSGSVVLIEAGRVSDIDSSFLSVSKVLKRFGRDVSFLLQET